MLHLREIAILALLLTLPLPCLGDEKAGVKPEAQTARSVIKPYVNWLPWTAETLVVLARPYHIPPDPGEAASLQTMTLTAVLHEAHLRHMFEDDARDVLVGKTIKLWIEGSMRFRFPQLPEDVQDFAQTVGVNAHYDGCHVLVFDDKTPLDATELYEALLRQHPEPTSYIPAASRHQIAGYETIAWSASHPEINQSRSTPEQKKRIAAALAIRYWIASPQENVLIVATSRAVLAETLRKVRSPDQTAFPATLEEWNHVTGEMPIWGIRHYQTGPTAGDGSDLRHVEGDFRISGFAYEIDAYATHARLTFLDCSPNTSLSLKRTFLQYDADAEVTQGPNDSLAVHLDWSDKSGDAARQVVIRLAIWLVTHLGHSVVI